MNKYQIIEIKEKAQHAGSKARGDVALFAEEIGYNPLYIKCRDFNGDSPKERIYRFFTPAWSWFNVFRTIKNNSIVLVQNPFYHRQFGRGLCLKWLKKIKHCTIVSVVHDVECLRGHIWFDKNIETEFAFMKENSDYEIVHNDFMKEEFQKMGFDSKKLIALEIFDYKSDIIIGEKNRDVDVVVAGNLNPKKCPYVYIFSKLKNKFSVNLYGPNYEVQDDCEFVKYNGSFPPDEIPNIVEGKFGLVWDGDSVEECSGETGNYLRYNNPHKTSLYIVSKMPVIIWSQAAMAKFIEKEKVGITIDSLEEIKGKIESLTSEEYADMLLRTEQVAEKLKKGFYIKQALADCERRISS